MEQPEGDPKRCPLDAVAPGPETLGGKFLRVHVCACVFVPVRVTRIELSWKWADQNQAGGF